MIPHATYTDQHILRILLSITAHLKPTDKCVSFLDATGSVLNLGRLSHLNNKKNIQSKIRLKTASGDKLENRIV